MAMNVDMWLDEKTLQTLKSLSKKLVSPGEHLSLSQEEALVVQKIRQDRYLPYHLVKHFLANGVGPEMYPQP